MSAPLPDSLPGEVDVVVVGAGGAGMCAALAAAKQGLDVVLVEKSGYFGGSTARSGGGVWMPGNAALEEGRPGLRRRHGAGQALPRLDRRRRGPEGPPRHLPRPRPRGARLHPRAHPGPVPVGPAVRRLPPRGARRPRRGPLVRAGPAGRAVPRRRARPAAPAVHEGAGQHDRDAGRLPEDQPRPAHLARPGDDDQGPGQPRHQRPAAAPDVRHGQRDRDRPPQGADGRGRAGRLRHRADRPGH